MIEIVPALLFSPVSGPEAPVDLAEAANTEAANTEAAIEHIIRVLDAIPHAWRCAQVVQRRACDCGKQQIRDGLQCRRLGEIAG